jgi:hypothetical protein
MSLQNNQQAKKNLKIYFSITHETRNSPGHTPTGACQQVLSVPISAPSSKDHQTVLNQT